MGLRKILARRPNKSTPEQYSYEFEPPLGSSLRTAQDDFTESAEASPPSMFLKPQLSLNSMASRISLQPSFRSEYGTQEPPGFPQHNFTFLGRTGTSASSDSTYFDHSRGTQRPKREHRKPPVSFRKPSSTASLSLSYHGSSTEDRSSEVWSSVGMQRERSNSMTSVSSGRFKDLLDAQEEIRSIDFRTRVEATGARDYGEDVADRNMHLNAIGDLGLLEPPIFGQRTKSLTSSIHSPHQEFSFLARNRLGSPTPIATRGPPNKSNIIAPTTNRFSLHTYTPSGLTSLNHSGFTFTRDGSRRPIWTTSGVEDSSRPYNISPIGSKFSMPRSPKCNISLKSSTVSSKGILEIPRPNFVSQDVELLDEDRTEELEMPAAAGRLPFMVSSPSYLPNAAATSATDNSNYRFSIVSSTTSRHTSGDYTPLDPPRTLAYDAHGVFDHDSCRGHERHLDSYSHSPQISGDESLGHISTISSGLRPGPSASKGFSLMDERSSRLHHGDKHEWEPTAPSNAGSASTLSNPSYSGSSGRPQSRHTKATSFDSERLPTSSRRSEDSCHSTTFAGQDMNSPVVSPMTTNFNIYDYISSDDESFTTDSKPRQPTGEGEEDLLFKAGYGSTGAALPGLSEASLGIPNTHIVRDSCPCPIIRDTRPISMNSTLLEEGELEPVDSLDIDDDNVSVDRDLPTTFIRHISSPVFEMDKRSTLGRNWKSCRPLATKATSFSNTEMSGDSEYYTPPDTANGLYMYNEEPMLQRGLQRLSAFGTWHGRDFVAPVDPAVHTLTESEDATKKVSEPVEKEKISCVVRARKAAKAQKRAEHATSNRQKRLTRTFGNLEQDITYLLSLKEQEGKDNAFNEETTRGQMVGKEDVVLGVAAFD